MAAAAMPPKDARYLCHYRLYATLLTAMLRVFMPPIVIGFTSWRHDAVTLDAAEYATLLFMLAPCLRCLMRRLSATPRALRYAIAAAACWRSIRFATRHAMPMLSYCIRGSVIRFRFSLSLVAALRF